MRRASRRWRRTRSLKPEGQQYERRKQGALSAAVSEIADRFRAVFERRLWEPFVDRGMPADEIPSLTADVGQLTELATSVVTTELHDRFAAFAAEYPTRAEDSSRLD